jgi:hypothetical protein
LPRTGIGDGAGADTAPGPGAVGPAGITAMMAFVAVLITETLALLKFAE